MEVYVARQPIFNQNEEVIAYELLYRKNEINKYISFNPDKATIDVLVNSFLNIGISDISKGKPCFINFTKSLLDLEIPTFFQPYEIVIEILEHITPSPELITICKQLKELGYTIVLDDFIFDETNPYLHDLIQYIDILKIDFQTTSHTILDKIGEFAKKHSVKLLAEKVETREQFELAKSKGFTYFQGYFFAKPVVLSSHDIPTYFRVYHQIIEKIYEEEPDFNEIATLIEKDLSLSYKLLKLINSPALRPKHKIYSIRQALAYLGLKEIEKWVNVLALRDIFGKSNVSIEIFYTSLVRAKMCDEINKLRNASSENADTGYFILGLFSMLDAILGIPMETILQELPIADEVCDALLGKNNEHKQVLDLVKKLEKGEWEEVNQRCQSLEIDEHAVYNKYKHALKWSFQIF